MLRGGSIAHVGSGIYRISGPDITSVFDDSSYLVTYDNCSILIDSGSGISIKIMIEYILSVIRDLRDLKYLIITHAHHRNSGGVAYIKDLQPEIMVIAHTPDSYYIRNPEKKYNQFIEELGVQRPAYVSIEISEEEREIKLCGDIIRIIHTPCHTEGSMSILISRGNILYAFVGGLLEERISSEQCRESFRRILAYRPDVTCYSQGCIYGSDRLENIMRGFE
ncbi:MAG: MBL fold metallo-hydrolase [Sulfolobales archaeon]